MKRLVLTFLSTAAVCAVLSAKPVAAQDTVTGAPAGTAPVTVEGYENSSGPTGAPAVRGPQRLRGTGTLLDILAPPLLPISTRPTQWSRPSNAPFFVTSMTPRQRTQSPAVLTDLPAIRRAPRPH